MKKVLLSFVGNTDPWAYKGTPEDMPAECPAGRDREGAALGLCDYMKPDAVYLFPSCRAKNPAPADNTEWRAERIRDILVERFPEMRCVIVPLDVYDATDFGQLSEALDRNISFVLDEAGDDADFFVNCTSGTQQMTATGYVLANTGRLPSCTLLQCKDPGRLKDGEPRVREVEATFLTVSAVHQEDTL